MAKLYARQNKLRVERVPLGEQGEIVEVGETFFKLVEELNNGGGESNVEGYQL